MCAIIVAIVHGYNIGVVKYDWKILYTVAKIIRIEVRVIQGVKLILCFFEDFEIYSGLWPLSVSPRIQSVYIMAGRTPALAAELTEFRKITTF